MARRRGNLGPRLQEMTLPAPTGGINAVDPARELPPRDCLYAYNVLSTEKGVRARTAWREWVTGLTGTYSREVKVTMSFQGSQLTASKLFQTTDSGIWDTSSSTTTPTRVYAFVTSTPDSGWGVAQAVTTAGGHFLLYADEVNGLHYYSETTNAWAAYTTGSGTGQINGVDPARIVSVTVWKNRVWLTEKDTAKAWYLDVGAVFGTATAFNFGQRFRHGGNLVGLFNWSINGGDGLDTQLVAIGAGGDVVIYSGTDPSSVNTFGLKGVWNVGAVPAGRTVATDAGGDLMIISALGVVPLSRLVLGDPDQLQYATAKVSSLFSRLANASLANRGWALHTHPTDNALLVLVPVDRGGDTEQLVLSLSARSWTQYRDVPLLSAGVWQGDLFFGTSDGRCCRMVGHIDGVTLADPDAGDPVEWSLLMPYRGNAREKQVHSVRPVFLSDENTPTVEATVLYDFDLVEPAEPTLLSGTEGWGFGLWGTELWSSGQLATIDHQGAVGMGRDFAVAIRGSSLSRTTLVGVDVLYETGGYL